MKKKILIFIDWYLPGYKAGGPIQSIANLVDHLKEEFEFLIVTRDSDYCDTIPYSTVKSNEWNKLSDGVSVYYFSADKLTGTNIRNLIANTEFDQVYLNGIYSYYFTLIPLAFLRKKNDKKILIASRGMLSEGSMNVKKVKKQFFLRAVKLLKLFDKTVFHATTQAEVNEIKNVFGDRVKILTAGNLPQKNHSQAIKKREKKSGLIRLVNVARIAPEKNLIYALKALKNVKNNVEFDFYGPVYNQEYWAECKLVLDELPGNVKASYKGSLESTKVNEVLSNYEMMFMPTTGENFGHIILQALTAGCPVIISDQTPWNNLKEKGIGYDISLSEISEFSDVIDEAASMSQIEYNAVSEAAAEYAVKYINNPLLIQENRLLFS